MKRIIFLALSLLVITRIEAQQSDSLALRAIYTETLVNSKAYDWLRDLTQNIGGRLSGSPEAAMAVKWAKQTMIEAGADTVILQEVMVPHWVRGAKETAAIIEPNGNRTDVAICALGNSIATPKEGVKAEVIEVSNFEELDKLGEAVKGKIVFYNYAFDESHINTFESYGDAVGYRWAGASKAAQYGALATVCRSMTNAYDNFPHTGSMHYADTLPKIPCCAISTMGANLLSRVIRANKNTQFEFRQDCQMLDSVLSYNVIGELRGTEFPDEYVVVSGHLDAWDNGQGAHDDGAGVVQSMEAIRALRNAGLRPKRTIRAVAYMNEENGLRGGIVYANEAKAKGEVHVAAMESDAGGFLPIGFGLDMEEEQRLKIKSWAPLFLPYGVYDFEGEWGGADISKLENMNVPQMGLYVSSQRYFDLHHAGADTFDKVNKRELLLGAATMASMAYLIAMHGL